MRSKFIYIICLFLSSIGYSQSVQVIGSNSFGGYYDEILNQVRVDSNDVIFGLGSEESIDGDVTTHLGPLQSSNFWYLKLDSNWTIENQLSFGGTHDDNGIDFLFNSNGVPVLSGTTRSPDGQVIGDHPWYLNANVPTTDFWIFKPDTNNNINWQGCFGGGNEEHFYGLSSTKEGGYLLAGTTQSTDGDVVLIGQYYNMWVVKTDSLGHKIWVASVSGPGSTGDEGRSVCELSDSSVVVGGDGDSNFSNFHGNSIDIEIAKFDQNGNLIWTKCFGGSGGENCTKVLADGLNFFIIGTTASSDGDITTNLGGIDIWIAKVDSSGHKLWDKSYGGTDWDIANGATRTSDGGIAFTGWSYSNDGIFVNGTHGGYDIWAAKIDSVGNLEWGKSIGGSSDDEGRSIAEIDPHHYVVCGYSQSSDGDMNINHGGKDAWIGEIEVSPVNVPSVNAPNSILTLNYKDEYLKINIASSGQQKNSLTVCDVLGRMVTEMTVSLITGYNEFELHLPNLKGIYIVKVGCSVKKIFIE